MANLRVLTLNNNPLLRTFRDYRKRMTIGIKNLKYLDDRPVFDKDRACAEAWARGGREEERAERDRWNERDRRKIHESVMALATLRTRQRLFGPHYEQVKKMNDDLDSAVDQLENMVSDTDAGGDDRMKLVIESDSDAINTAADGDQIMRPAEKRIKLDTENNENLSENDQKQKIVELESSKKDIINDTRTKENTEVDQQESFVVLDNKEQFVSVEESSAEKAGVTQNESNVYSSNEGQCVKESSTENVCHEDLLVTNNRFGSDQNMNMKESETEHAVSLDVKDVEDRWNTFVQKKLCFGKEFSETDLNENMDDFNVAVFTDLLDKQTLQPCNENENSIKDFEVINVSCVKSQKETVESGNESKEIKQKSETDDLMQVELGKNIEDSNIQEMKQSDEIDLKDLIVVSKVKLEKDKQIEQKHKIEIIDLTPFKFKNEIENDNEIKETKQTYGTDAIDLTDVKLQVTAATENEAKEIEQKDETDIVDLMHIKFKEEPIDKEIKQKTEIKIIDMTKNKSEKGETDSITPQSIFSKKTLQDTSHCPKIFEIEENEFIISKEIRKPDFSKILMPKIEEINLDNQDEELSGSLLQSLDSAHDDLSRISLSGDMQESVSGKESVSRMNIKSQSAVVDLSDVIVSVSQEQCDESVINNITENNTCQNNINEMIDLAPCKDDLGFKKMSDGRSTSDDAKSDLKFSNITELTVNDNTEKESSVNNFQENLALGENVKQASFTANTTLKMANASANNSRFKQAYQKISTVQLQKSKEQNLFSDNLSECHLPCTEKQSAALSTNISDNEILLCNSDTSTIDPSCKHACEKIGTTQLQKLEKDDLFLVNVSDNSASSAEEQSTKLFTNVTNNETSFNNISKNVKHQLGTDNIDRTDAYQQNIEVSSKADDSDYVDESLSEVESSDPSDILDTIDDQVCNDETNKLTFSSEQTLYDSSEPNGTNPMEKIPSDLLRKHSPYKFHTDRLLSEQLADVINEKPLLALADLYENTVASFSVLQEKQSICNNTELDKTIKKQEDTIKDASDFKKQEKKEFTIEFFDAPKQFAKSEQDTVRKCDESNVKDSLSNKCEPTFILTNNNENKIDNTIGIDNFDWNDEKYYSIDVDPSEIPSVDDMSSDEDGDGQIKICTRENVGESFLHSLPILEQYGKYMEEYTSEDNSNQDTKFYSFVSSDVEYSDRSLIEQNSSIENSKEVQLKRLTKKDADDCEYLLQSKEHFEKGCEDDNCAELLENKEHFEKDDDCDSDTMVTAVGDSVNGDIGYDIGDSAMDSFQSCFDEDLETMNPTVICCNDVCIGNDDDNQGHSCNTVIEQPLYNSDE